MNFALSQFLCLAVSLCVSVSFCMCARVCRVCVCVWVGGWGVRALSLSLSLFFSDASHNYELIRCSAALFAGCMLIICN